MINAAHSVIMNAHSYGSPNEIDALLILAISWACVVVLLFGAAILGIILMAGIIRCGKIALAKIHEE